MRTRSSQQDPPTAAGARGAGHPSRQGHAGLAARLAATRSARLSPAELITLQRSAGNAAVGAMLREREESRRHDEHVHGPGCAHRAGTAPAVQRSAVLDTLRTPGEPLSDGVRAEMEARLGADFSDVRIHTDSAAHASATAVQAHAYTSGSHIVFQRSRYDGASEAGKRMLAHELTHVLQQREGPVMGTDLGDGTMVSDPSDRFEREAEQNAVRVMNKPAPVQRFAGRRPAGARSRPTEGATPVQRICSSPSCQDYYCQAGERCSYATPTYSVGQHGNKLKEQQRLSTTYNTKVSGASHQSEHVFGYRPLQGDSGLTRGKSAAAKQLENQAPAYQELKDAHRMHVGTGTSTTVDASGFNSQTYRDYQRSLFSSGEAGGVSAAAQLNSLGYAFNQTQPLDPTAPEVRAMNDSHLQMVNTMGGHGVSYAAADPAGQGAQVHNTAVSWEEQYEMRVAHYMSRFGFSFEQAKEQALKELGHLY